MKELATLRELVAIPSITGCETQLADYVEARYTSLGHHVTRLGDNIVVRITGIDQTKALVVSGHLDTVPPTEEWSIDPFQLQPRLDDGDRWCGLGVSDMQSGLAHMIGLAEDMAGRKPPSEQYHIYTTDEEGDQRGAKVVTRWLAEETRGRYNTLGGVILEPTNAAYVGAGIRGDTNWYVTAEGPGGHGSREFDDPPLERVSALIASLSGLRRAWAEKYTHPLLGKPMINATVAHAGEVDNVVPSMATCKLNLRVTPQLLPHLDQARQDLAATHRVTIHQTGQPSPTVCAPTEHICRVAALALPGIPFQAFPGATEQVYFPRDIPMIVMGPGDDATMHEPDESMSYSAFAAYKQMLMDIVSHF